MRIAGFEIRDSIHFINSHRQASSFRISSEPIALARKPLDGTLAANILKWRVGGLNIDACRIPIDPSVDDPRLGGIGSWKSNKMAKNVYEGGYAGVDVGSSPLGRFPSNIILDKPAAALMDAHGGTSRYFQIIQEAGIEELLEWCATLVTPSKGLILDPFDCWKVKDRSQTLRSYGQSQEQ